MVSHAHLAGTKHRMEQYDLVSHSFAPQAASEGGLNNIGKRNGADKGRWRRTKQLGDIHLHNATDGRMDGDDAFRAINQDHRLGYRMRRGLNCSVRHNFYYSRHGILNELSANSIPAPDGDKPVDKCT